MSIHDRLFATAEFYAPKLLSVRCSKSVDSCCSSSNIKLPNWREKDSARNQLEIEKAEWEKWETSQNYTLITRIVPVILRSFRWDFQKNRTINGRTEIISFVHEWQRISRNLPGIKHISYESDYFHFYFVLIFFIFSVPVVSSSVSHLQIAITIFPSAVSFSFHFRCIVFIYGQSHCAWCNSNMIYVSRFSCSFTKAPHILYVHFICCWTLACEENCASKCTNREKMRNEEQNQRTNETKTGEHIEVNIGTCLVVIFWWSKAVQSKAKMLQIENEAHKWHWIIHETTTRTTLCNLLKNTLSWKEICHRKIEFCTVCSAYFQLS